MMRNVILWILLMLMPLTLLGCKDKTELEERAFIGSFALDLEKDGLVLSAEAIRQTKSGGEDESKRELKRAKNSNLASAMYELNDKNSKELNFALSKAVVLGEELLKDTARLKEVANALTAHKDFSGKLIITAAKGEAAKSLENPPPQEDSAGEYISNYYKHKGNKANYAFCLELEALNKALNDGGGVVIPLFTADDGENYELSGAALVKDNLLEYKEPKDLRGLIWARGLGRGQLLTVKSDSMRVTVHKTSYDFREEKGELICEINVKTKGHMEERPDGGGTNRDTKQLEKQFAEVIFNEIKTTYNLLTEKGIDGYELTERLKKRNPSFYEKYGDVSAGKLDVKVSVKITN